MQQTAITFQEPLDYDLIDWNLAWNHRMLASQAASGRKKTADQWQGRKNALAYWEMAKSTQKHRIEKTLADLPITPDSRVLDIGSGPGVLTIPLARKVRHVTAVDASEAMIAVLSEKAAEAGISNVNCLNKCWESVAPARDLAGPYDVVLASLCLTMFDLQSAVTKMEQACRGHVYLYWFSGSPGWEDQRRVFEPFAPGISQQASIPKCGLLLKVLKQNGICPNIELFPYVHIDWFNSVDAAADHFYNRFRISGGKRTHGLRECVQDLLEEHEGGYRLRSEAECMKIWWQVQ